MNSTVCSSSAMTLSDYMRIEDDDENGVEGSRTLCILYRTLERVLLDAC
jgi:hypothetical protein